jgi:hypothetical protein
MREMISGFFIPVARKSGLRRQGRDVDRREESLGHDGDEGDRQLAHRLTKVRCRLGFIDHSDQAKPTEDPAINRLPKPCEGSWSQYRTKRARSSLRRASSRRSRLIPTRCILKRLLAIWGPFATL